MTHHPKLRMKLSLIFLIAIFSTTFSQTAWRDTPRWNSIAIGTGSTTFRDRATSPLYYNGNYVATYMARMRVDSTRENHFSLFLKKGVASPEIVSTSASISSLSLSYRHAYTINALTGERSLFQTGAILDGTGNIRQNPHLTNSGVGIESLITLLGTFSLQQDISRDKPMKFLLVTHPPKDQFLTYRVSVGVLNLSYRNGYNYIYDIVDPERSSPFDDYSLKLSGWRLQSSVDYKRYHRSGTATGLSYHWEAYNTKGDYNPFQLARHTLLYTLYFQTRKDK